ncbi:hypothetical protein [Cupriavidus basilensis]|uniref:hypothetical protein n=1 Tax=Cupriavidus basilensis TaxID=68895 RepID=UPI0023E8E3C4|nr:hypothetical protein [Cupriavidus basilensis]MDF3883502.1 hypothetical protein [Cupriavidus basilensis]
MPGSTVTVAVCAGNCVVVLSAALTLATTWMVAVPAATPVTVALPLAAAAGTTVATVSTDEVQAKAVEEVTSVPLLSTTEADIEMLRPTPTCPEVIVSVTEYFNGVVSAAVLAVLGAAEFPPPPPPPQPATSNAMAVQASHAGHLLVFVMMSPPYGVLSAGHAE